MERITHNLVQGTPEWHALRRNYFTASEAPAMMGVSKYMTRNELLALKKFGVEKERSAWEESLLASGHRDEERARVLVEENILCGAELYPATVTYGNLLASLDGITLMRSIVFEHKKRNASLVDQVQAKELEPHYWVQLEQELYVSGAQKVIFAISDGTEESLLWMDYRAIPGRMESILAGWEQFAADLEKFELVQHDPKPEAAAIMALPSLFVNITGKVEASNIAAYRSAAMQRIESIKTELVTDQDFADAEATVKWCEKAEKELAAVKKQALGQTATIDELFSIIDCLSEALSAKRLLLKKLVTSEKEARKEEVRRAAVKALAEFIAKLEAPMLGRGLRMPQVMVTPDFAGATKNKRTMESIQNAVDTELAQAKVAAQNTANLITANLQALDERIAQSSGYGNLMILFPDLQALVGKERDDFAAVVDVRIVGHEVAEAERLERVRQEADAKARADVARELEEADSAQQAGMPAGDGGVTLGLESATVGVDMARDPDVNATAVVADNDNSRSTVVYNTSEPARNALDGRLLRIYHGMAEELKLLDRTGFAIAFGRAVVREFANDNDGAGVSVAL